MLSGRYELLLLVIPVTDPSEADVPHPGTDFTPFLEVYSATISNNLSLN
jgi:hypothetical protein